MPSANAQKGNSVIPFEIHLYSSKRGAVGSSLVCGKLPLCCYFAVSASADCRHYGIGDLPNTRKADNNVQYA